MFAEKQLRVQARSERMHVLGVYFVQLGNDNIISLLCLHHLLLSMSISIVLCRLFAARVSVVITLDIMHHSSPAGIETLSVRQTTHLKTVKTFSLGKPKGLQKAGSWPLLYNASPLCSILILSKRAKIVYKYKVIIA